MLSRHLGQSLRQRAPAAILLVAALSMLGLSGIYVLHYAAELACPGQETGDPYDCFICTSLFTLGLELPVVGQLPDIEPTEMAPPPEHLAAAPQRAVHIAGARSPPSRLQVRS